MKKSDLKTGMLIKTRQGKYAIVMKDIGCKGQTDSFVGNNDSDSTWFPFATMSEDLTLNGTNKSSEHDIVEVWSYPGNSSGLILDTKGRNLLFKRQEILVKLNSDYEAEVLADFEIVKVGCQEFTFESVEDLYKAVQKAKVGK